MVEYGYTLMNCGKYNEADTAYDDAIRLSPKGENASMPYASPDLPNAWYGKGMALSMQGKHEEAIQAYNMAIKINPNIAEAWFKKGKALEALADAAIVKSVELDLISNEINP